MDRLQRSLALCRDRRLAAIVDAAGRAALAAGEILRRKYDTPLKISNKGRIDLVTEADLAAEQAILQVLRRSHSDIGVLAEESAADYQTAAPTGHSETSQVGQPTSTSASALATAYAPAPASAPAGPDLNAPLWVIDPLDGTTNFAHAIPWFAVSIGYLEEGRCRAGIIYNPISEEFFCGMAGGGAWLNGQPIKVSRVGKLEKALLATGFPYAIEENTDTVINMLKAVLPKAQGIRRAGAAALDLAYVACGRLDGFWEINLKPWDTAAGIAILNEAGGRASDFAGRDFSPFIPQLLASNGALHDNLRQILAAAAPPA